MGTTCTTASSAATGGLRMGKFHRSPDADREHGTDCHSGR
jgi:hypothetical protein